MERVEILIIQETTRRSPFRSRQRPWVARTHRYGTLSGIMAELRWNPLESRYVMVAGHRQNRPQMPQDWCPFCPGSGRVPEKYTVFLYPNDFPALSVPPAVPTVETLGPYTVTPARGRCEVILYSSDHNGSMATLDETHLRALFQLWKERYLEVGALPDVKYVLEFENRGELIGVTMPHPHGQLYGFPFIPPRMERELEASESHFRSTGRNLFADILNAECSDGRRIVFKRGVWTAFVPFCADFPFEIHVYPNLDVASLADVDNATGYDLLLTLRQINRLYDCLYDFPLPFMMAIHQNPTDGFDRRAWFRMHVKFYPLHRSRDKIKYCASCETDAFAHCNPTYPEEKAEDLRQALQRSDERFGTI